MARYNRFTYEVQEKKGVTFLTYPAFDEIPGLIHCFSTRLGGVSNGIYSSMNLSFTRGGDSQAVAANYSRLGEAVGFDVGKVLLHLIRHIQQMLEELQR